MILLLSQCTNPITVAVGKPPLTEAEREPVNNAVELVSRHAEQMDTKLPLDVMQRTWEILCDAVARIRVCDVSTVKDGPAPITVSFLTIFDYTGGESHWSAFALRWNLRRKCIKRMLSHKVTYRSTVASTWSYGVRATTYARIGRACVSRAWHSRYRRQYSTMQTAQWALLSLL